MVEHAAEVISPIIELLVDIVASNATPSAIDLVQQILLLYVDTKKVGGIKPKPKTDPQNQNLRVAGRVFAPPAQRGRDDPPLGEGGRHPAPSRSRRRVSRPLLKSHAQKV